MAKQCILWRNTRRGVIVVTGVSRLISWVDKPNQGVAPRQRDSCRDGRSGCDEEYWEQVLREFTLVLDMESVTSTHRLLWIGQRGSC